MPSPYRSNIFPCTSLSCDNCRNICNSEFTYKNEKIIACSKECCLSYFRRKKEKRGNLRLSKETFEEHAEYQDKINSADLNDIDLTSFGIGKDHLKQKKKAEELGLSNWDFLKNLITIEKSKIVLPVPKKPNQKEMKKYGVHITHCCLKDGCKYGDEDCPVALGLLEQSGKCERCQDNNDPFYY